MKMTVNNISFDFLMSTKGNFPKEECTIESADVEEVGIFESHEKYLCALVNIKKSNCLIFMNLSPFVQNIKEDIHYGWYDVNTREWYDNMENPINDPAWSNYYVIGFIKVDNNSSFDEIWKKSKQIIESEQK